MKLFFTKAELQTYVGFNDHLLVLFGMFPLAFLGNILFGGSQPGMDVWENFSCYGIALAFTIVYWVICRYWVIRFRMWFPQREQTVKRILITLPVLAVMVGLVSAVSIPLISLVSLPDTVPQPSVFYKSVMSYTLVLMVVAAYEGTFFFMKYQESLLEQERLARENMQTQLAVLKQQMNPHFLFNSLNTLVNVIPEDAAKATVFTQRLAAVYRRILEYRHKELIDLEEELVALQDYIFLMQTRYEEKLVVTWRLSDRVREAHAAHTQVHAGVVEQCETPEMSPFVPAHLRQRQIVPLSVQLLVENAIKHNVISTEHPLHLEIILEDKVVTVRNRLRLRDRKLNSTGWGHHNLQRRYESLTDREMIVRQTDTEYAVSLPTVLPQMVARAGVG